MIRHLVWHSLRTAQTRTPDRCLRGVFSLSLAEYSLVGSFTEVSVRATFWVSPPATLLNSDLETNGFVDSSPGFLPAEDSLIVTAESGSSLGFLSSLAFSATGSFSLVFALLQSSLPEGFSLSLDSVLGSIVIVETRSFVSKWGALPFVICCSGLVGATGLGAALAGTSNVVLDDDAAL